MNENQSLRIGLTIPARLLKAVDNLALRHYATRSDILRVALVEFMKKSENAPRAPDSVLNVLADDRLQVLRQYKNGKFPAAQLEEKGIPWPMQLELMKLGEL